MKVGSIVELDGEEYYISELNGDRCCIKPTSYDYQIVPTTLAKVEWLILIKE